MHKVEKKIKSAVKTVGQYMGLVLPVVGDKLFPSLRDINVCGEMAEAIRKNNLPAVRYYYGNLPQEVQKTAMFGPWTYLHDAAYHGRAEIVKFFLQKGCTPNVLNNGKNVSPLMVAIARNHFKVAEALLDGGADVNMQNSGGTTALMMAVSMERAEMVGLLLQNGAKTMLLDKNGNTVWKSSKLFSNDQIATLFEAYDVEKEIPFTELDEAPMTPMEAQIQASLPRKILTSDMSAQRRVRADKINTLAD